MAPKPDEPGEPVSRQQDCDECGETFLTAQGLGGHKRLAHRAATTSALAERESELGDREADLLAGEEDLELRKRQLDTAGPEERGMVRCPECGSWSENQMNLSRHRRGTHPIEPMIAEEVGRSHERVSSVWIEACHKQERHPDESPEQIVLRFWNLTDRRILRALVARNASFHFSKDEE